MDKEAVRSANPLEEVIPELTGHPVAGNGAERLTRCHRDGHSDVHASLRINVEKQQWFCDPCQSGGDVFAFIQEFHGVDFQEAFAFLAVRAGLNGNAACSSATAQSGGGGGALAPRKPLESSNTSSGITLAQYAEAKGLPEDFLRKLGLDDLTYMGAPAVRTPFFDTDGSTEKAVQFRIALDKNGVYPGFPTLFWGLSGFFVNDLMGKALWSSWKTRSVFQGAVGAFCASTAPSASTGPICMRQDRRVLGLQSTRE